MNTKKFLTSVRILIFVILTSASAFGVVLAQTTPVGDDANIQYPISDLGNCQNKDACKSYCDKPANTKACIAFAEKNNLMTTDEIAIARKFLDAGAKGPGGCTSKDSCESYCNNISRIDECVSYAEKIGILPPQELEEAKQIQSAIARGVQPPPCKNKKECDAYCDDPVNMKACVTFGEAAGFLKGKDLEDAKKMMAAIEKGAVPPACKGKEACDTFCSQPENMEQCMTFAQAAGFMSPQEEKESKQVLEAIKKGVKMPACKGKEACDKYCAEDSHIEECIAFSVAAGFMSEKDAEMAKKTGGKGPGGCSSKDECDAFCQNPQNQETCFGFAKENGMISQEDLEKMQDGQSGQNQQGQPGDRFQPGPENINPGGQPMPQQAGPGGCKGPEECKAYCESHQEECKNFQPPQNQPGQPGQPGQMQFQQPQQPQGQFNQPGQMQPGLDQPGQMQPGQFNPLNQPNPLFQPNPLNQLNQLNQPGPMQPGQFIQVEPGQMEPQQQLQPQFEPQPQIQPQENLPPPPSSFLQGAREFLANVLDAF